MSVWSDLRYASPLTVAEVAPETDLLGVWHPSGVTTERSVSLAALKEAFGGGGAGGAWFPSVVNCPAAVPGEYSLANSGVQMFDAQGVEFLRIWATDPNTSHWNAGNLHIGAESGLNEALANDMSAGYYNIGLGNSTLRAIVSGYGNVAIGMMSMVACGPDVNGNTALGNFVLPFVKGGANSAVGNCSMISLGAGGYNSAIGEIALGMLRTGSHNVGIGYACGFGTAEIKMGAREPELPALMPDDCVVTDSQCVLVGANSGRSLNAGPSEIPIVNAIALGYATMYERSNTAVIGNAAVTDVYCGSAAALANVHAKSITLSALPTAVDGLAPGTLWNNAGVVNVAP